jgi:hypothetical protein
LKVFTDLAKTCKGDFNIEDTVNIFHCLQDMSSDKPEVVELLKVLTGHAKTCKGSRCEHKIDVLRHEELLNVMTELTKKCEQREPLSAQVAENMIFGMQGLRSDQVKKKKKKKKKIEKSK